MVTKINISVNYDEAADKLIIACACNASRSSQYSVWVTRFRFANSRDGLFVEVCIFYTEDLWVMSSTVQITWRLRIRSWRDEKEEILSTWLHTKRFLLFCWFWFGSLIGRPDADASFLAKHSSRTSVGLYSGSSIPSTSGSDMDDQKSLFGFTRQLDNNASAVAFRLCWDVLSWGLKFPAVQSRERSEWGATEKQLPIAQLPDFAISNLMWWASKHSRSGVRLVRSIRGCVVWCLYWCSYCGWREFFNSSDGSRSECL